MKPNVMLKIASLLSLLLLTLHLVNDVVLGISPGGIWILYSSLVAGVLLYGVLVLAERRSGQVIMLLVSLFAVAMPFLHTKGAGVGAIATKSSSGFFFVWTLVALGTIGTFSFILSVRALRST